MTDESELRGRLAAYVADEPALDMSLADILALGRRDRRRQRGLAVGAGVTATILVGGASAYAFEAISDGSTGGRQVAPAAPGRTAGHGTHGPTQRLTASADIPAAIRAVVAEYAPGFSTEKAMVASTWQAYNPGPGSYSNPPPLSSRHYDKATSWVAEFQNANGTNWLQFELDHLPPDKPAGIFGASCAGGPTGDCQQRTLADGRHVVESYSANRKRQTSGGFLTLHTVQVADGDYRVAVTETVTDASSPNPHQQYQLTPRDLLAIASDRRLVFPNPKPLPPLPSWERCLYAANPPADCP